MSHLNSMDISNLASIFSPTLMRPLIESVNLENAFREIKRSQNILKLLLNYEKLKIEKNKDMIDSVAASKAQSSIITNVLNVKEMSLDFDSYASKHTSPEYSPVLSSNGDSTSSPQPNTFTPPLSPRSNNNNNNNYKPLLSDRSIIHRKRPNNRPISVSLDSSILPSLLNNKDKIHKLSPINENHTRDDCHINTKNLEDFSKISNFSNIHSNDNNDENNENNDRKVRNSLGNSGMKSLPVKSKTTKIRPMSTSAVTSTSLSYLLKMFMTNKDEKNENKNDKNDSNAVRPPSVPPSSNKRITSLPKKV